jgi:hypothetical protein
MHEPSSADLLRASACAKIGGAHVSFVTQQTRHQCFKNMRAPCSFGSQELIDPSIAPMIEAGLQRYRLSHGLPATQAYGHLGGKRRVRPQQTMRGRGRWTWSKAGCALLLILFLLCGGLGSDPQIRSMLVNGLFSLFHLLAHP